MDNQVWIADHFKKLTDQITDMIFDDPELVTDPTNLDELHDKLTQMIFANHEFPMSQYRVDVEELTTGGYRINIGLDQAATAVVVK